MRRLYFSWLAAILLISGCSHRFLQRRTNEQLSTLTEMNYKQVLNNLAMFECNPDMMAYFAVIGSGSTQGSDAFSGGTSIMWSDTALLNETLNLRGDRQLTGTWSPSPVQSAGRLQRLSCAFKLVVTGTVPVIDSEGNLIDTGDGSKECIEALISVGILPKIPQKPTPPEKPETKLQRKTGESDDAFQERQKKQTDIINKYKEELKNYETKELPVFSQQLEDYKIELTKSMTRRLPRGWYHVGTKHDVPHHAKYVGRYQKTYVWVDGDGIAGLTQLTLTALALAAVDPPSISIRVSDIISGTIFEGTASGDITDYLESEDKTDDFKSKSYSTRSVGGQKSKTITVPRSSPFNRSGNMPFAPTTPQGPVFVPRSS